MKKIIICLFLLSTVLYAREIQILSSKVVDVEDETIALVEKRIFYVLDSLGLKIAKKADLSLRTEMIQLDNGEYLLNFEMTQGGKVLRSKRDQLKSLQYMDVFVSDLLEEMLNTQIEDYEEDNRVEFIKKIKAIHTQKTLFLKVFLKKIKTRKDSMTMKKNPSLNILWQEFLKLHIN